MMIDMNNKIRVIFAIIALIPTTLFILPLWHIDFDAPQFPEGLGLYIYINDIQGTRENALETINNLNHYIGMQKIKPEEVPEFKIIPIVTISLIVIGLISLILKKRIFVFIWLLIFSLSGIVGLIDYYLWQQEFGHNLDPNAIIKTETQSYDPPFIGSKKIMNFTVSSYPASGGILVFSSLIAGWILFYLESKINSKQELIE